MARIPTPDSEAGRQLDITLAVAMQRAQDVHVRQALELITHTHGRVGIDRALGIYGRIHGLPAHAERVLAARVLAALGQADLRPEGEGHETGFLASVRRRLRGRRDHELRRWVEFHKGRTDRELVEIHVDAVARAHGTMPEASVADAVAWYTEVARLTGAMRDNVYLAALARLDDTRGGGEREGVLTHPESRRRASGAAGQGRPDTAPRFRATGD